MTAGASGTRPARQFGFTLLEVILALSLTAVILGLIIMAVHVQLGVADKSEAQVQEAQLARALLQRIADDVRNAVPFRPTQASSSTASSTSQSQTTSVSSDTSTDSTASTDIESADTTPVSTDSIAGGGICGNSQCLYVETSRRMRPNRVAAMMAADDLVPVGQSDIRTVTYCLGDPGTMASGEQAGSILDTPQGLYRREMDRAEFNWAIRQSGTDALNLNTELLAPEVVQLRFTYYDSTMSYDTWDSTMQGKLPDAVKVAIAIRRATARASRRPVETIGVADTSQWVIYDMLVAVPNSQVQTQGSSQGQGSTAGSGTGASTSGSSTSEGSNR